MKSTSEMPGTLEAFIQTCGTPIALFSDNAPEQCNKQVNEILVKSDQSVNHFAEQTDVSGGLIFESYT
jgi:hypothetical protein